MSDIIEFPKPDPQPDLLIGPFESYKVVVEGRAIPRLTGYPQDDGRITLIVDGRFMVDFPADLARQAAWLIAQALAVGEGYTHLGGTNKDQPFAPQIAQIGGTPEPAA